MKLGAYFIIFVSLLLSFELTAKAKRPSLAVSKTLNLPSRPKNAMSGSQFLIHIKKMNGVQRERAMVKQVLLGNVPAFVRALVPIEKRISSGKYRGQVLRYWVLPDYLAIGSNVDFVRIPMNLRSIKILTEKLNLCLPTTKMVDEIYSQANIKLKPRPLPFHRDITGTKNIARHESIVKSQLAQVKSKPGYLFAGHKKDVVQSNRLLRKPKAIAIYGWHRSKSQPIQPLSTVHSAEYADYSHGVRLIANTVEIGGKQVQLKDALSQRKLVGLLSYEGVSPRAPQAKTAKRNPFASR
jgi:hypothetical protein